MNTFYTGQVPGRTVQTPGGERLWCSGTSYLGMAGNAVFRERVLEGLTQTGTNWGSSRSNTLRLKVYEQAETALADWTGAPAALTVSSGMLAGQTAIQWLTESLPKASFYYSPTSHPAVRGPRFTVSADENWFGTLADRIRKDHAADIVIVTDSIGSPHVEPVPFDWISQLPDHKRITLLVDDSHGIGVFGEGGRGIYKQLTHHQLVRVFVVASLNKALGVPAGVILGPAADLAAIRQFPLFTGASPASPGFLWALTQSFGLYEAAHAQLMASVRAFTELIAPNLLSLRWFERYPAFTTTHAGLHEFLETKGILTACFPYPGPNDPAITRLVINPLHTPEDLVTIARALNRFFA
jgi:8-amino-7-oxononanoate synthase